MKTVAAAMGADVSGDEKPSSEFPIHGGINIDQQKLVSKDNKSDNETVKYGDGDIKLGKTTAFGYKRVDKID